MESLGEIKVVEIANQFKELGFASLDEKNGILNFCPIAKIAAR